MQPRKNNTALNQDDNDLSTSNEFSSTEGSIQNEENPETNLISANEEEDFDSDDELTEEDFAGEEEEDEDDIY